MARGQRGRRDDGLFAGLRGRCRGVRWLLRAIAMTRVVVPVGSSRAMRARRRVSVAIGGPRRHHVTRGRCWSVDRVVVHRLVDHSGLRTHVVDCATSKGEQDNARKGKFQRQCWHRCPFAGIFTSSNIYEMR